MKINVRNSELKELLKFLEGGQVPPEAAPAEEAAPAPDQGGDPMLLILAACLQALQSQDCNLAMQVCQALIEMAGGGAPPEQAPEGQEPVYRRGGRLVRFLKKF